MDCRVCAATGDVWVRMGNGVGVGGGEVGQIGGFSHESEHDLAVMVRDFLEVGSSGNDSRYSSDSDSGFCDLVRLADHISYYKLSADQYESDLLSVVNSLLQSIKATDLHLVKSGTCNASCVRYSLVKLLRLSGYDAAVCASKWQGSGKVPGGDHEYIDVINHKYNGSSERLIIDIDFRSHFEIARAVESYDRILNSLPVIYVGSLAKLKRFLQAMVEAASSSLKQNSMPLPPWRSLSYLLAKWHSPYQRRFNPDEQTSVLPSEPKQCIRLLKSMQSSLRSEIEVERLFKPINSENNRRLKLERWRHSLIRTL
ncbi:Signal transduction histidine-protein kinase [Actinidia chinensis var. chinensis]|uniref:Signal transduction histidine-protein kinase n=1 Tax=Actinidia chinensis var. chinensis TaxID=1590841 RepID=A0A2R6PL97_ACTCC|nr:Signal transduction histidine-protein kinase [Actinidia chinensis var. chinensis]